MVSASCQNMLARYALLMKNVPFKIAFIVQLPCTSMGEVSVLSTRCQEAPRFQNELPSILLSEHYYI